MYSPDKIYLKGIFLFDTFQCKPPQEGFKRKSKNFMYSYYCFATKLGLLEFYVQMKHMF